MASKTDELIERLLAMYSHRGDGVPTQLVNPDGPAAVDIIKAQDAKIKALTNHSERLRKAVDAGESLRSAVCGQEVPMPYPETYDFLKPFAKRFALARQALKDTP